MEKELADQIIASAQEVHKLLGGPGLLESVYESALCHELSLRVIKTQRQVPIPVLYKGAFVRDPLYLDILVEDQAILEIKATERDYPFFQIQLSTYLRLTGVKSGMLINFGKQYLKDGICRLNNNG